MEDSSAWTVASWRFSGAVLGEHGRLTATRSTTTRDMLKDTILENRQSLIGEIGDHGAA